MFGFLLPMADYDDRMIGRFDDERTDMFISTAEVNDGRQPFETAVAHPDYRPVDTMVIVEAYDNKALALIGHENWIKRMTVEPLPEVLTDCQNSEISQMIRKDSLVFPRQIGGAP